MFSITGQIINIFEAPEGKNKEGQAYGGETKVQLLGEFHLKNGEAKKDLMTLSVPVKWEHALKQSQGKEITLPVGVFVTGGAIRTFIPEDAPLPVNLAKAA